MHATKLFGNTLTIACPDEFEPGPGHARRYQGSRLRRHARPKIRPAAVKDADLIITDTWVSMGDTDASERRKALKPYRVDTTLMARAKPDALFMHCLPAHRGDEVTDEVIDGPQSVVFDEAENRLHAQKAILCWSSGSNRSELSELQLIELWPGSSRKRRRCRGAVYAREPRLPRPRRSAGRGARRDPDAATTIPHRSPACSARRWCWPSLIGSSLKFEGKFILQTQTDGPVNLIVVDLDAPDGLRGYARFDADAVQRRSELGATQPGQLLGKGHLAMTVDQGAHMDRYQGIVALEGDSLEEVAHRLFPAVRADPDAGAARRRRASPGGRPAARLGGPVACWCSIMPPHGAVGRWPDLPGDGNFDNPDTADPDFIEDDNWTRDAVAALDVGR